MRAAAKAALAAALLALTACAGAPDVTRGPPPLGAPRGAAAVPGLIVGHRLMAAGEAELALRAYGRAAAEGGMSAEVLTGLGSANLELGRLGQAEDRLRVALRKDEGFVPAWNNLGVVLMETDRPAEAAEAFRRAYALDNGDSDAVRDNLRLALARRPAFGDAGEEEAHRLLDRGGGAYLLLTGPGGGGGQ